MDDNQKVTNLYHTVNLLMDEIGAVGSITAKNILSVNVMDALYDMDGGVYQELFIFNDDPDNKKPSEEG